MQCSYWAPKGRNTSIKMGLCSRRILRGVWLGAFIKECNDKSIISFTWYIKHKSFVIASSKETLVTALRRHAKQGDNRANGTNRTSRGASPAALPKGNRGSGAESAGGARPNLS